MDTLFIHEHALKHGLTDEEIRHAWRNAFVTGIRKRNDGFIDILVAGFSQNGKPIEMVGRQKNFGVLVFHANTPISQRMRDELELTGR